MAKPLAINFCGQPVDRVVYRVFLTRVVTKPAQHAIKTPLAMMICYPVIDDSEKQRWPLFAGPLGVALYHSVRAVLNDIKSGILIAGGSPVDNL